ncbi:hypothetical protein GCM10023151_14330 [Kangiella marina]|uniref:Immunity protein 30 domain-containing protein n=1 Tax=Kangiella marina TaxID=1079178 RepID=A0ABP8IKT8_9GAMM
MNRLEIVQKIHDTFQLKGLIDLHKLEDQPYILEECSDADVETYIAQIMIYCLDCTKSEDEPFIFSQLMFYLNELSKCKNTDVQHLSTFRNMEPEKQGLVIQFLQHMHEHSKFIIQNDRLRINKIIKRLNSQL